VFRHVPAKPDQDALDESPHPVWERTGPATVDELDPAPEPFHDELAIAAGR
jgi:hypothetical protein